MTILTRVVSLAAFSVILFSALFTSASADGSSALLLASDSALRSTIQSKLPTTINTTANRFETDYSGRAFITDEGSRLSFSDFFHDNSLQSSKARKQLHIEYDVDFLVIAWIAKEKTTKNEAYDLRKTELSVRVRIIDASTGREVFKKSLSHDTEFALSGTTEKEQTDNRRGIIQAAANKLLTKDVLTSVTSYAEADTATQNTIRIAFRNMSPKEYHRDRSALIQLVEKAGASGTIRDHYEANELTLRTTISVTSEAFYRTLYGLAVGDDAFDHFDLSRDGNNVLVELLPAKRKRLIISGISSEGYHSRLDAYRSVVSNQTGVKDISAEYIGGPQGQLVLTFTYKNNLSKLEEGIWKQLEQSGNTPNRKLVSITEQAIHYRAGKVAGEKIQLTININNVAPGDYRKIGAPLDKIVKGLNLIDIDKTYDRVAYRLTYTVDTTLTAIDIDSELWRQIAANPDLNSVVQDETTTDNLGYFYHEKRPPTRDVVIHIRALSPSDYGSAGRSLVAIIKGLTGVSQLKQTYSESDQTLVLRCRLEAENAYYIDDALWAAVEKDPALKDLALGELDENELEYFFSGSAADRVGDLLIQMRLVNGQDYKQVSTEFADLLGKITGVRNVRYRNALNKKTVIFRLQYEGDGIFHLDDAMQRAMVKTPLFKYVSKGREQLGRLVYFFSRTETTLNDTTDTEQRNSQVVANNPALKSLDDSVVYLYVKGKDSASEGSGFIVSNEGHILTNAHVIGNGIVYVRTYDGTQYRATQLKSDSELDLAIIRIVSAPKSFPHVLIGNSNTVARGDPVTVIGNPLGARFEHSVMIGIVSGTNRGAGLFQLSIPTFPGISGSPVFNKNNRVIGVMVGAPRTLKQQVIKAGQGTKEVVAITAVESIGLAIPINHARSLLQLVKP